MRRRHLSLAAARRPGCPGEPDPPLSPSQLSALRESCAPVGALRFPPVDIIRTLRQYGYVEIVLGGIQITPSGLERLIRERGHRREQVEVD
jgi:hypothetical protein